MRLVPEETVPKALGIIYTGLALASAFAAPIGSYVGGIIGWRGVFWALTPLVVVTLIWQWLSLPRKFQPTKSFLKCNKLPKQCAVSENPEDPDNGILNR